MTETAIELTAGQLDTLRHMLGINDSTKRVPPSRNHAAVDAGDPKLHELARLGMVELYAMEWGYEWFRCTDAGRAAAIASQKARLIPKKQRIYLAFLDLRDCWPDLTFRDFLTSDECREARERA